MRVRGNFDVYAYDEDDPNADRVTPTRVIQFQVDNLKNLESTSKIYGKSYTLWIPWDESTLDSKKKNISLIVRFRCNDGNMVMSHMAKVSLPGLSDPNDVDETVYVNPYADEKKYLNDRLSALAEEYRNNTNLLDTERIVSREDRPEMMVTKTINMPGVSRDGVVPTITPTQTFASATDEQKYMAKLMIANAQTTMSRQPNNSQAMPNQNFPIDQVQYQSSGENSQVYQQPMLQPNSQPMFQQQQQMQQLSQRLVPMSDEAKYQEYLNWQRQQAMQQQPSQQQPPQQPLGNYASANQGITRR